MFWWYLGKAKPRAQQHHSSVKVPDACQILCSDHEGFLILSWAQFGINWYGCPEDMLVRGLQAVITKQ